jgi:hypothetical protein
VFGSFCPFLSCCIFGDVFLWCNWERIVVKGVVNNVAFLFVFSLLKAVRVQSLVL